MYKPMIKEISTFMDDAEEIGYEMIIIHTPEIAYAGGFSDVLLKNTGLIFDSEQVIGRQFVPYDKIICLEVL